MVQLSKAFEYADFKAFDRQRYPKVRDTFWVTLWDTLLDRDTQGAPLCLYVLAVSPPD